MADALLRHGNPTMVDYTPSGADVAAGAVIVVGEVPMVAHVDITDGTLDALATHGGIYLMTGDALIAAGTLVYWDDTAKKVTETASGNLAFGYTVNADIGADDETGLVRHEPDAAPAAA